MMSKRNYLINSVFILAGLNCWHFNSYCQEYFNTILAVGGTDDQGEVFSMNADDSLEYFILGDRLEDGPNGIQIRPWIGWLSSNGELFSNQLLFDTMDINVQVLKNNLLYLDDSTLIYYASFWDSEQNASRPFVFKFNVNGQRVVDYKIITPPDGVTTSLKSRNYVKASHDRLLFSSVYSESGEPSVYLFETNYDLEIARDILVESDEFNNYPYYIGLDEDKNIILIGDSYKKDDKKYFKDRSLFYMIVDSLGAITYRSNIDLKNGNSLLFPTSNSTSIVKKENNDWMISCVERVVYGQCVGCYKFIPITLLISQKFDSIYWFREFKSLSPESNSEPIITSLIELKDDEGYVTAGFDGKSFLYKVNGEGDSVWVKKYSPMGWEDDRLGWSEFSFLEGLSNNDLLIGGRAYDNYNQKVGAWVVKLDKDGCYIEECDSISQSGHSLGHATNRLELFPNPAGNSVTINWKGDRIQETIDKISMYNVYGQLIDSFEIGDIVMPFTIDMKDQVAGGYVIIVVTDKSIYTQLFSKH
jgi:hypothetical protein